VTFNGDEHQVVAIAGVSVRLRSAASDETVVLATYLMGSPGFGVIDGEPRPQLSPFGLLDSLPDHVVDAAKQWEHHIVEIITGVAPDPPDGAVPRPEYDAATRTLSDRETAKAAELAAAGMPVAVRTLQRLRARYAQQGLWGLVDQRATRGLGEHRAGGRAGGRRGSGRSRGRDEHVDGNPIETDSAGEQGPRRVLRTGPGAAAGQDDVLQADRHPVGRAAQLRVRGHPATNGQPPRYPVHADTGRSARRTGSDRLDTAGRNGAA
jgi:hypothetical protein